jgi:hypothetical protein
MRKHGRFLAEFKQGDLFPGRATVGFEIEAHMVAQLPAAPHPQDEAALAVVLGRKP